MRPLRDLEHRGVIELEVAPLRRRRPARPRPAGGGGPRTPAAAASPPCTPPTSAARRAAARDRRDLRARPARCCSSMPRSPRARCRSTSRPTASTCWRSPATRRSSARRAPAASGRARGSSRSRSCAGAPAATPSSKSSRSSGPTASRAARRTPSASPACSRGLQFIADEGVAAIRTREEALRAGCSPGSRGSRGCALYGPDHAEERTPVVSVTFDGLFPSEAGFPARGGLQRAHARRPALLAGGAPHDRHLPAGDGPLHPGVSSRAIKDIDTAIEGCRYLAAKKAGGR